MNESTKDIQQTTQSNICDRRKCEHHNKLNDGVHWCYYWLIPLAYPGDDESVLSETECDHYSENHIS